MNKVLVNYSNFNENIINEIVLKLFKDVQFEIKIDEKNPEELVLLMKDEISANVELQGNLDYDTLNSLLKALSTFKKQHERS